MQVTMNKFINCVITIIILIIQITQCAAAGINDANREINKLNELYKVLKQKQLFFCENNFQSCIVQIIQH